jgi:hypothetical protein
MRSLKLREGSNSIASHLQTVGLFTSVGCHSRHAVQAVGMACDTRNSFHIHIARLGMRSVRGFAYRLSMDGDGHGVG